MRKLHALLAVPLLPLLVAGTCEPAEAALVERLVGDWDFTWVVEEAGGLCEGEVGEEPSARITIVRDAEEAQKLLLEGFGDANVDVLEASIEAETTVEVAGSFSDDGGTTTTSTVLTVSDDATQMTGTETWSWESELQPNACPNNRSSVSATRVD